MAGITTIYCEGTRGSHDFDILNQIVGEHSVIRPIGSKRGAGAVIEFIEKGANPSDFHLFFRDRDFDRPVPEKEELIYDGKKTYFSYRTTIENYLFDLELFFRFIAGEKLEGTYRIHSQDDVKRAFINAARNIKDYQAVRHTLGEMRSMGATFNTTWTKDGSGDLPDDLSLNHCKKEGWNSIQKAKDVASGWTKESYEDILSRFSAFFDDRFFSDLKFLIYFQGKDFARALQLRLEDFPMKDYYKFAKANLDFTKYKDLMELQEIINSQQHKIKT
jgi:hypothetical protein